MDQNPVGGPLEDPGNGRPPAVPVSGPHDDGEAFKVCGKGADVALEAGAPDITLYLGRGPPGQRIRGRALSSGSGTEFAVEGFIDEGPQPGTGVEVALGSEAPEALAGFGRDADMERNIVLHKDTLQHMELQKPTPPHTITKRTLSTLNERPSAFPQGILD